MNERSAFMTRSISRWIPIALCCVPGVIATILIGAGIAVGGAAFSGFFSGPLGLGLTVLVLLACPLTMGLMMKRASKQNVLSRKSAMMTDCCVPGQQVSIVEADRLASLRRQRESLEREVADLQAR
jgi:hypothetical protein